MHARNRTWPLGSDPAERCRQRTLPVEGGDGSTLTLDFTTGVLDPRLTFTRGTNATFINSSGLVQYAASNQLSNSVFVGAGGATGPTGWLVSFIGGTGNFSLSGTELTISNNGSADRSRIYQTGPTGNGLFVTVQMKIVANNTGGLSLAEIVAFSINGQSSVTYRVNGVTQTSSYTGWTAGDLVTLTCIPTVGSAATCLFGVGCSNNVAKSASVTIKDVQIEVGTTANTYNPTTTSGAYYAPRFDYDPTTLAPRGLLIEGSATNLLNWSESFATSGGTNNNWADTNITRNSTNNTDPANGTTALRVTASGAGNGTIISTAAIGTSAQRTFSIWLRRVSGSGDIQYTLDNGSTYTTQAITSSWVRYTFASTTAAQRVGIRIVTSGDSIELWGAQLEAGSGASSYIPTGASQGTRNADECSMTGTNFSSWFTNNSEGSFLVRYSMNNPSAFLGSGIDRYAYEVSNSAGTSRVFCNASYRVTVAGDAGRFPRVFDLGTIDLAPSLVATAAQNTAFAWGYKSNDNHLAAVGVTANDTSGSLQTGLDRMHLGTNRNFGSTTYLFGCISLLKYWPTRLPNATLQGLVS